MYNCHVILKMRRLEEVLHMKIGFDNDKYLALQAAHIKERRSQFGDKLYLEFGGKLLPRLPGAARLPARQQDLYAGHPEGRGGDRHCHLRRRH